MKAQTPKLRGIETRQLRDGSLAYRVHFRVPCANRRKQQSRQFASMEDAIAFRERFTYGKGFRERMTVTNFIETRWLPSARHRLSAESLRAERCRLDGYIVPHFGNTYLDAVTRSQWERFSLTVLGSDGQQLSGKSKQNLFGLFHAVLQYAVELELIEKNPIAKPLGSRRNTMRPHRDRSEEKPVLLPEQFQAILKETPEQHRPLLWTFAITGLRASEVAGLQWRDYDPQCGEISVRRGAVRRRVGNTKTVSTLGRIGVSSQLRAALSEQRFHQTGRLGHPPQAEEFIFGSRTGKPLDADRAREDILYPAMKRAAIVPQPRRHGWHLFRHSALTAHQEATGDIYRTSRYAGHSSVAMTASTYLHVNRASIKDAELVQSHWMKKPQTTGDSQSASCASSPAVPFTVPLLSATPN